MITEKDLREAIEECQGQRNPTVSTCIKLAAFLTIQREMFGTDYSFAPAPDVVDINSESDFARRIRGRKTEEVWAVMDELMETIKAMHPRLYDAVMAKF